MAPKKTREKIPDDKLQILKDELISFCDFCDQNGIAEDKIKIICAPLSKSILKLKLLKWSLVYGCVAVLFMSVYFIPVLNWYASAVGRILMIKVLPLWDWTPLFEARCLINKRQPEAETPVGGLIKEDCGVCEDLSYVDSVSSVDYEYLMDLYLSRGSPVVVEDSHPAGDGDDFSQQLVNISKLMDSSPCDLQTNLYLGRTPTLKFVLHKIVNKVYTTGYFIHFENCQKSAVKAARIIIPKSYFLSPHLPPAYANWIVLSKNHTGRPKNISLEGMVVFLVISGRIEVSLYPKMPCEVVCAAMTVDVREGQAMIWSTELWKAEYKTTAGRDNIDSAVAVAIDW